jgi:putative phosphonate catabolism associated alcohol dehydrogenase
MTRDTTTAPPPTGSRAAIFTGTPGELRLDTLPTPRPGPGEMLVRVLGCTLCGSDLHSIHGRRQVPVPTVLGHEIVGRIEAWGDATPPRDAAGTPLAVGDRVTWAVVASCGRCLPCRRGLPQKCRRGTKYGHEPLRPGRELLGGLAEHCLLVAGTAVVRLPDALPLEIACPASCATATAVAVCEAAGLGRGAAAAATGSTDDDADSAATTVCVLGAGLLGLSAIAWAAVAGARVICIEPDPHRRALAQACGATACCPPEEAAAIVESMTGGEGCDAVLELAGARSGWETSWRLVRTGGRIVLAGAVVPVPAVTVEPEQIVRRHISIHGVHNYAPRHLVDAVAFLAAHGARLPLADLVAEWFPLERIDAAVARAADRAVVRVGVRP